MFPSHNSSGDLVERETLFLDSLDGADLLPVPSGLEIHQEVDILEADTNFMNRWKFSNKNKRF